MCVLFIIPPAVVHHISECHKSGRTRGGWRVTGSEVCGTPGDIRQVRSDAVAGVSAIRQVKCGAGA